MRDTCTNVSVWSKNWNWNKPTNQPTNEYKYVRIEHSSHRVKRTHRTQTHTRYETKQKRKLSDGNDFKRKSQAERDKCEDENWTSCSRWWREIERGWVEYSWTALFHNLNFVWCITLSERKRFSRSISVSSRRQSARASISAWEMPCIKINGERGHDTYTNATHEHTPTEKICARRNETWLHENVIWPMCTKLFHLSSLPNCY